MNSRVGVALAAATLAMVVPAASARGPGERYPKGTRPRRVEREPHEAVVTKPKSDSLKRMLAAEKRRA